MDTTTPAVFVNGELLKLHMSQRVRTVVQVMQNEGGTVLGQSTDNHQLTVKGTTSVPVTHFMEVIGVADGPQSIRAEICTDFGSNFDTASFNGLCKLANGEFKNFYM
ncbi:Replication protein A 14 kDa subunit [Rhynchospora pubera]|uniref:Replication protein A 14 kDa subunit n=1 Tax=Rhynchospora pubera TaxID=906938 RepID=A0AAV8DRJ2_9POAL|nr:Replication protein A 14 kDa subunit [Rhynchospora pubera]KAJ4788392.1 Replication protein A 14 kDa subunit [Rhynchospora pubera]